MATSSLTKNRSMMKTIPYLLAVACVMLYLNERLSRQEAENRLLSYDGTSRVISGTASDIQGLARTAGKHDSLLNVLASKVDRYTESATTFVIQGGGTSGSTTTITKYDTVRIADRVTVWPEYEGHFKDEWMEWHGRASRDTFIVDGRFRAGITVKREWVRQGPLRRRELVGNVEIDCPYLKTGDSRSFSEAPPRTRFAVIAGGGIGYTGRIQPWVGIGIGMKIFQF